VIFRGMCVFSCCLIVVPLLPGKNPFAVELNNMNIKNSKYNTMYCTVNSFHASCALPETTHILSDVLLGVINNNLVITGDNVW
jgi:hypothetical protein